MVVAADLERIILSGVGFNDQVNYSMESLVFIPAQAKPKLAENPNADGVVLVEEPHFTPAYFEMAVRVIGVENTDQALAKVGTVVDALMECARLEGGSELEWIPNDSVEPYTAYAILGELIETPITVTGDLAGWFVESPILKIKITCRPFLYRAERLIKVTAESSEQFQTLYISGVQGDVPAEARLIIKEKSGQARNYIEWGQDRVKSETNPTLQIKASTMVITNFSGTKTTKAGSVSSEVITSKLVGSTVTICSTGPIAHLGTYRGKLRVYANGKAFLRIAYRVGEGNTTSRTWVEIPELNEWCELDLHELLLEAVEHGEQASEVLIQGYIASGTCEIWIDTLGLMPTRRYAVGRGTVNLESPTLVAYDKFEQSVGELAGKTATIGGTWAGAGDADDFKISSILGATAWREAVSDTSGTPRYEILGSGVYSNIVLNLQITTNNRAYDAKLWAGILARYVDVNNWAALVIEREKTEIWPGYNANRYYITLYRKVAGAKAPIGIIDNWNNNVAIETNVPVTIILTLILLSTGEWTMIVNLNGGNLSKSGFDTNLSSSGALKEGKVGLIDEKTGSEAELRLYDNFEGFVPIAKPVCNTSKAIEIGTQGAQLESTNGKYWNPIPQYRGSDLYLDPEGRSGMINRLAVKMRRQDISTRSDPNVTDKQLLEGYVRERFLIPR